MAGEILLPQNGPSGAPSAGTDLVTVDATDTMNVTNSAGLTLPVAMSLLKDIPVQAITEAATLVVLTYTYFIELFLKYTLAAGSGAYTLNLELPVLINGLAPVPGQCVSINLEFAATANPVVIVWDTNTAGTNLTGNIASPNPAVATYWYGKFKFGSDGHWHMITNNWN